MAALPRANDQTRPRTVFAIFVLEGIERMTTALRRGDPFSAEAVGDMVALHRRFAAFSDALDARLHSHGMGVLIDTDADRGADA
jgi:hypothetical protein